ncbi:MAG: PilZ domain-containing protein [Bacillota bacterium]
MQFQDQMQERAFRPRPPRVDIGFDVLLHCADAQFEARIVNLSARGFRVRSPRALEPGCEISLQSGKLPPVRGLIRWAAGNDAGGSFMDAAAAV